MHVHIAYLPHDRARGVGCHNRRTSPGTVSTHPSLRFPSTHPSGMIGDLVDSPEYLGRLYLKVCLILLPTSPCNCADMMIDPTASATPTREWQEQLSRRLSQAHNTQWAYKTAPLSPASPSSSSAGGSTEYSRTRRRLDWSHNAAPQQQNWDNMYTIPSQIRMSS